MTISLSSACIFQAQLPQFRSSLPLQMCLVYPESEEVIQAHSGSDSHELVLVLFQPPPGFTVKVIWEAVEQPHDF